MIPKNVNSYFIVTDIVRKKRLPKSIVHRTVISLKQAPAVRCISRRYSNLGTRDSVGDKSETVDDGDFAGTTVDREIFGYSYAYNLID